jgi:hypothetical protein
VEIQLAFCSIYNVYNILARLCRLPGMRCGRRCHRQGHQQLRAQNGRMQHFTLGGHHGTLLTSKHENSIAYDTNLRYIRSTQRPSRYWSLWMR